MGSWSHTTQNTIYSIHLESLCNFRCLCKLPILPEQLLIEDMMIVQLILDTDGNQPWAEQCVCVFLRSEEGIASQNWCPWKPLPKTSSLLGEGIEWWRLVFVWYSMLLPEFQAMRLGACTTLWILLMTPYLQLRSIENAERRGRASWADHTLCLCSCHPLLSGSRKLWGSLVFPAEHSFLKNKNLCKNAWSMSDCCYTIPSLSSPNHRDKTKPSGFWSPKEQSCMAGQL